MSTYKGLSKKEFEALPREQQLARMALVRPGVDSEGKPLPKEEQDAELLAYVEFFFNMRFPTTCHPDCVGKCTPPARVLCDCYYARYPLIVLKASRSSGKTAIITTLAMAEVISLATAVDVLGASERQSNYIMEYINSENPITIGSWWTAPNAPTALLDPAQSLRSKQVLTNGGKLECLTASQKTVRGRRPTRSRCDECLIGETQISTISGKKNLEDIQVGEEIVSFSMSSGEFTVRRVVRKLDNGIKKVYKVCLSDGRSVVGTADHLFLSSEGWISIREVLEYEYMFQMSESNRGKKTLEETEPFRDVPVLLQPRQARTEAGETKVPGVRSPEGLPHRRSLSDLHEQTPPCCSTPLCGLPSFVEAKNSSLQTLPSKIHVKGRERPLCGSKSEGDEGKSIEAGTGFPGTTEPIPYRTQDSSACFELFSGLCGREEREKVRLRSSWILLARQASGSGERSVKEKAATGRRLDSDGVSSGPDALMVASDGAFVEGLRIMSIEDAGLSRVYDLEVEGDHTYVAQGLIVHNCDEAELTLIKSAQGCPKTDHVNRVKKQMLLASTHQHTDGTFSYYWNMASERNKEASIKAGKPTVVIPTYQYCYKDVLISNGGFLSDEEMEETRLVTPEDMWEAEYENGEPNFTGRLFKQWQLDFLFDKHMLGQEAEETKFSGAEDELIEIPMDKLFPNKTVEVHGHIKRFRTAHKTQDHLEFNYGADFANDVDWSVYNRLVTNVLRPQDPTYVQGWYRTGRKDTWKEIVESYNDFCNEHPGMGQHDETGNKAVNDYIDCDSEGFTFSKKTKKPLLDALVVAIQNRRLKGPFIDWAYKEFKFLTREHLTGKKHLPDSVASLALAWHSVQESLGEETDGKIPVGFVGA